MDASRTDAMLEIYKEARNPGRLNYGLVPSFPSCIPGFLINLLSEIAFRCADCYSIDSGFLRFASGKFTGPPTRCDSKMLTTISVAARASYMLLTG